MHPLPIDPKVTVIQDGARRHYAVPIALQRAGILERVFTEWYTRKGSIESFVTAILRKIDPSQAKRMAERFAPELDATRVYTKPSLVLSQRWGRRKFKTDVAYYAWLSDLVGRWVLDQGFGQSNALYGFVRNIFPDLCSTAKSQGLKVITDQMIAPAAIEQAEAVKQQVHFPTWHCEKSVATGRMLADLERGTWDSSHLVTCMSDYVRDGLISSGLDAKKIVVLPYPVDSGAAPPVDRRARQGPVTVGFVGQIGLRKGAPYFFEVGNRVDPDKVRFVMVGPLAVERAVVEQVRGAVELPGPVPRGDVTAWMEKFDIFLFPSTCEGSAGAVTEAMMAGLPIVTSRNSGSLVRHGIDGFICPYDDVDRMAHCIKVLAADRDLRHQMGASARAHAETYDMDHFGNRLKELYTTLLNAPG